MSAYSTAGWENFFVAEVGASAALAGLLFVAVSINLNRVLASPQLPGRAAETLIMLVSALAASTLGLVPAQSRVALGLEQLGVASVAWLWPVILQVRLEKQRDQPRHWLGVRVLSHQLATLPLLACGASLLVQAGGGLYWLVPGVLLSFVASIVNAWVLLIEIQR